MTALPAQQEPPKQTSLSIIDNVNLQQVQATMQKIAQFQAVVQRTLKKGHDYGVIPGTGDKPTLLKPGAEKILMLMGLTSEYDVIEKVQDYEGGFFAFTVKCTLYRGEQKITEGVGHANTRERRYTSGKQQDPYTLANTVLKMAKKRAQIDAVLTVASLSEIFTQDLEDYEDMPQPAPAKNAGRKADQPRMATEAQRKKLFAMSKEAGLSTEDLQLLVQQTTGKTSSRDLTQEDIQKCFEAVEVLIQAKKAEEEANLEDVPFYEGPPENEALA